jgi:hypothetical protein
MVHRLPDTLPRLGLPANVVLSCAETGLILAPLQTRGGPGAREGSDRQVCAAETVAGALLGAWGLQEEQSPLLPHPGPAEVRCMED